MSNLVEMFSQENDQHQSPCKHGNIVAGHACYCHSKAKAAPRKCPIWQQYGENDLTRWHSGGDFANEEWSGGCKWFAPNARNLT